MTKVMGLCLVILGSALAAQAAVPVYTPEIDPGSAFSALALISGAAMIIRGRRK